MKYVHEKGKDKKCWKIFQEISGILRMVAL